MKQFVLTLLISLFLGVSNSTSATSLTSITLDPEDYTGTTTNAPGAWSTNLADPLSQIGVFSEEGILLNQAPSVASIFD